MHQEDRAAQRRRLYPTIRGFYFSMTQYNVLGDTAKWIGFDNYVKIARDPLFWNALSVTLEYVVLNSASRR